MIPVKRAREPRTFDKNVRQPGLSAIDELIGRTPRLRRPGRPRAPVAKKREDIPPDKFPPFWRSAIDDLHNAYGGRCAYLATFIEPGTGVSTVDHFIPKSKDWRHVYEWSNYRLCAGVINGTKGNRSLLDPFKVQPGWFGIEFVSFQVVVGPSAPAARLVAITTTIRDSGINARECCALREQYVTAFEQGDISRAYLDRRAPFVASEMRRVGRIV